MFGTISWWHGMQQTELKCTSMACRLGHHRKNGITLSREQKMWFSHWVDCQWQDVRRCAVLVLRNVFIQSRKHTSKDFRLHKHHCAMKRIRCRPTWKIRKRLFWNRTNQNCMFIRFVRDNENNGQSNRCKRHFRRRVGNTCYSTFEILYYQYISSMTNCCYKCRLYLLLWSLFSLLGYSLLLVYV